LELVASLLTPGNVENDWIIQTPVLGKAESSQEQQGDSSYKFTQMMHELS